MDLGRSSTEKYRFGNRDYRPGEDYGWKELPLQVRKDLSVQADDIEARFGHDPKALHYRLVIIPHDELLEALKARFGEGRLANLGEDREISALARRIEREGLQNPPVLEEGLKRALAILLLGWDLPYFTLSEPIEMPTQRHIPTLDGRR
jgi:hypothetical protein